VLYLLDANILITSANTYYGIAQVPEFWMWLLHQGESGVIKIPLEMYEEVVEGPKKVMNCSVGLSTIRTALHWPLTNNAELISYNKWLRRDTLTTSRMMKWRRSDATHS